MHICGCPPGTQERKMDWSGGFLVEVLCSGVDTGDPVSKVYYVDTETGMVYLDPNVLLNFWMSPSGMR